MGKYCKNCGNQIEDAAKFCPKCGANNEQTNMGAQPNYGNQVNYNQQQYNNGNMNYAGQPGFNDQVKVNSPKVMNSAAIGSFICSLIGLLIMTIPLGLTAIISGIGGLNRKKYFPNETGHAFAIAGIIIGVIEVSIMIYFLITGKGFFYSNFFNS